MPIARTGSIPFVFGIALAGLLLAPIASADDDATVKATTSDAAGYGFVFRDDLLAAREFGGATARIAVVAHASRVTLIRPRTAFVVEMLRSVESL